MTSKFGWILAKELNKDNLRGAYVSFERKNTYTSKAERILISTIEDEVVVEGETTQLDDTASKLFKVIHKAGKTYVVLVRPTWCL